MSFFCGIKTHLSIRELQDDVCDILPGDIESPEERKEKSECEAHRANLCEKECQVKTTGRPMEG